jgi:hypothetical protein
VLKKSKNFHSQENFIPPNPLSILQSSESNFSKAPIITKLCSPVVSFALQFLQATTYAKSGVALIGDAAHTGLLKRVFDSQSGPLQVARTLGMATLNSTP